MEPTHLIDAARLLVAWAVVAVAVAAVVDFVQLAAGAVLPTFVASRFVQSPVVTRPAPRRAAGIEKTMPSEHLCDHRLTSRQAPQFFGTAAFARGLPVPGECRTSRCGALPFGRPVRISPCLFAWALVPFDVPVAVAVGARPSARTRSGLLRTADFSQ